MPVHLSRSVPTTNVRISFSCIRFLYSSINTFDKPNATNKFSRLFPGVDFVKASFLDIMIDISNAMADIEHPVYVIIGRTYIYQYREKSRTSSQRDCLNLAI
jgi:aminoglycoside phosphotransferase family enzyme